MPLSTIVTSDPEVLGGTPVFRGTRVPVTTLFDHLIAGETIDEVLRDFPSISRDQVIGLLHHFRSHVQE